MDKKKQTIIIALAVIFLAGLSLLIALRLKKIGEAPVAPKPKATEIDNDIFANVTPAASCQTNITTAGCSIPAPAPVLHGPTPPVHSDLSLNWNCNQPGVDCFAVEKYEYAPAGSCTNGGSRNCDNVPETPVATIIITPPADPHVNDCFYTEVINEDRDQCIAYKVVAKDYNSPKDCNSCNAQDGTNCCIVKSDPIKICGLPKHTSNLVLNSATKTIQWTDNSAIERGFRIYRRTKQYQNCPVTEGAVEQFIVKQGDELVVDNLPAVAEVGGVGTYVYNIEDFTQYCYSVVAFDDSCGCGGPTITPGGPTSTPTTTPVVTATATPPPGATATATPQATSTPLPTSTQTPAGEPYCDYITANPTRGDKILTVNFTGKGFDTIRIKGYRFTFGDGQKKEFIGTYTSDHIQSTQHDYTTTGKFLAQLEILDDGDHWRTRNECKVEITVTSPAAGPTSPPGVPATSTPRPVSTSVPVATSVPGQATSAPAAQATATPRPTATTALIAKGSPAAEEPVPTEVKLPEAGIKIPALGGLIGGFILLAIGLAIIF